MNVEATIRQYLPDIIHLSLATCSSHLPWVCELHYAYDHDLNLYFRSFKSRRHSQEIARNPNVSGSIITQHAPKDKLRGVYFEGQAKMLEGVTSDHPAFSFYSQRFGSTPTILDEAKTDNGAKFYQITVQQFYVFDSRQTSPGQKYQLAWKSV